MQTGIVDGTERFLRFASIERGLSTNTIAAYRRDLAHYAAWLESQGVDRLDDVTPDTLAAYVRSMSDLTPSSITRRLSTVRNMHRFLFDEGILNDYAGRGVRTPKTAKRLPKALSIDEVERLLQVVTGDSPAALRDRAILELLYASGARVSEVVALDVDDLVDEVRDGGFLRVVGKGNNQRLVPFGRHAGRALDDYLVRARPSLVTRGQGTPALFVGARGQRFSRQSIWLVIQDAARIAEISTEVSPHTLRHSFATHLLAGGADVRTVQELLGHASVATTQIYTRVTPETLKEHYSLAHPRAR